MGLFQPLSESELEALQDLVIFMLAAWSALWSYFFLLHAAARFGRKHVAVGCALLAIMAGAIVQAWRAGWMHAQFECASASMRSHWASLLESVASGEWIVRSLPLAVLGLCILLLVGMFLAGASYSSSHRGSRSRWIPLLFLGVTILCVILALVIIVPRAREQYRRCGCDSWLPNLERRLDPQLDEWCTQLFCELAV